MINAKLFFGFILSSIIIVSVVQSGNALVVVLGRSENYSLLGLAIYSSLAVVLSFLLFILFRPKSPQKLNFVTIDRNRVQNLGFKFIQGFIDGLRKVE